MSRGRPPASCPFMARCCASTPRLPDGLFRAESGCWLSLFIFPVQEFGCAPAAYKPDYSMMKTTVARNKSCWDKHAVDCSALVRPPPSGFPSLEAAPAPGSCSLRYLNRPSPIRPQPQLKEWASTGLHRLRPLPAFGLLCWRIFGSCGQMLSRTGSLS